MWIQIYKYWFSSHTMELCYTYMKIRGRVFKSLFSIFLEIQVFVHISYLSSSFIVDYMITLQEI